MTGDEMEIDEIKWQQAGFGDARREQVRRWVALPLEDALGAVEALGAMACELAAPPYLEDVIRMEAARVVDETQSDGDNDDEHEAEGLRATPASCSVSSCTQICKIWEGDSRCSGAAKE